MWHEKKSYDRVGDIDLDFANIWHVLTLNRHVQGYVLVCFINVVVLWFMRWHVLYVSVRAIVEKRTCDYESVKWIRLHLASYTDHNCMWNRMWFWWVYYHVKELINPLDILHRLKNKDAAKLKLTLLVFVMYTFDHHKSKLTDHNHNITNSF